MMYIPTTTPHVEMGVSVTLHEGRTYITASYNGARVITIPAHGRIGDKLFMFGTCVPLTVDSASGIKRGSITV